MLALAAVLLCAPAAVRAQAHPWKFLVFGDSLSFEPGVPVNTNILGELAREVVSQHPDFLLYLGDFSLNNNVDELALWTNAMAPVFIARIPIYPVIGNHDYLRVSAISNLFQSTLPNNGPPGDESGTYALTYSNALVLVLNQFVSTNQYRVDQPWLDAALATNMRPHVFVAGHMPAFKVWHNDSLNLFPTNRDVFWQSLSNAHARVYFSGHDHFYDHSRIDDGDGIQANDLHQVIVGTGGAPLYPDNPYDGNNGLWTPVRVSHDTQYGYVLVEVDGDQAILSRFYRVNMNSYAPSGDSFSYSFAPRALLHHGFANGRLILSWSGSGALQAAPDLSSSFTNVPGATSPYVVPTLSGPGSLYYRLLTVD